MTQENFRYNNDETSSEEDKEITVKENEKLLDKQEKQKEIERLTGSQND